VNQSLSAQIANLSFNGSDNDSDLYNQINSLNFTLNGEILLGLLISGYYMVSRLL